MNRLEIIQKTVDEDNLMNDYYLGTFAPDETFYISLDIWNNKNGATNINAAKDVQLEMFFMDLEDTVLLKYTMVSVDNGAYKQYEINDMNRIIIPIRELSGKVNDGSEENVDNYSSVNIKFSIPKNIKNDFKQLCLSLQGGDLNV